MQYPPTMILALADLPLEATDCLTLYFADSQLFVATKTMHGPFLRDLAASLNAFSD